ncbi:MAG: methyltransferase domain-containing protein [Acidobacteria bacterium]|nr:MAG: methyltransferase domain-containing protein [Acidobacteriota bacterium]
MHDWKSLLVKPEFPRSNHYDPNWVVENQMGPNVLWLVEWLSERLALQPDMRVLDLGCGRAMSSIFLAREFGVRVWAADLWIGPDQNWRRVMEAGVSSRVFPMRLEAHAIPFPHDFFDAVVSLDAYTYFGTDDLYLGYLSGFVRPAGLLGIVVPGLLRDFESGIPSHLAEPQSNGKPFWEEECRCFHTPDWWRAHWSHSSRIADLHVEALKDGWRHWRDFEKAVELSGKGIFPSCAEALERDAGLYIGFVGMTAVRSETSGDDLYDPALGLRVGVDR